MITPSILLCTVGTGDVDKLENTLLAPLRKSIQAGHWQRVVLLPSTLTAANADFLKQGMSQAVIDVRPLPGPGLENDADACFGHFNSLIAELRAAGAVPQQILADFTRGTKAMSAALVLAAVRNELPMLRYVSGDERDARGMVVAGTEQIKDLHTTLATARHRLDLAERLLHHGDFAAVLQILPETADALWRQWPAAEQNEAAFLRPLSRFYGAWDRLDYRAACETTVPPPPGSRLTRFCPTDGVRTWVRDLSMGPPDDAKARAAWLQLLVVDLLANGERRLRDHQFEDAIIRAYRVLELVGQLRLCEQGIHSDNVPKDHPTVSAFQEELAKKGNKCLEDNRKGGYFASREQVARLLKRFKDPLAQSLLTLGSQGVVSPAKRNYSPFIHGFVAQAGSDPKPLKELYAQLEDLLIRDGGQEVSDRLRLARSIDLNQL